MAPLGNLQLLKIKSISSQIQEYFATKSIRQNSWKTHALIKDAKALKSLTQGDSKEVYFTGGDRCFSSTRFQGSKEAWCLRQSCSWLENSAWVQQVNKGDLPWTWGFLGKSSSSASKAKITEVYSQVPEKKEESRNEGSPGFQEEVEEYSWLSLGLVRRYRMERARIKTTRL